MRFIVTCVVGCFAFQAGAQGDQVSATTRLHSDGGTAEVGGQGWVQVRPHAVDPKYADAKAVLDKKPDEKAKVAHIKFGDFGDLEFYQAVQLWTTYTLNAQASPDGTRPLTFVDDRADLFVRRGRIGLKGRFGAKHGFNIAIAYDGLGKDQHNGVRGGVNPTNQLFFIWDAQWTYQLHPTWANITVGHFRPQIGRESITGAFGVNSFEKPLTQNYQRIHIVGRTQGGRETGVNVGGLLNGSGWGVNYNFGVFDTTNTAHVSPFGDRWAPMLAGRVALSLGDPELEKYALAYSLNYWGKRTGITLAVQGTTQGRTDNFERNNLLGFDVLANWRGLSLTAEFHIMGRNVFGSRSVNHVGHVRAGYAVELAGYFVEPTVTYMEARGASNYLFTGRDRLLELVLNWYIDKNNLKLNVAYSKNLVSLDEGGTSEFTDRRRFVRGDFVGLGLQFLY